MTRYLSGLCVAGLGLCGGGWLVVAAVAFGGLDGGDAASANLATGAGLIVTGCVTAVAWAMAWRRRMRADGVLGERFATVSRRQARRNRRELTRDVRRAARSAKQSAREARRRARRFPRLADGGHAESGLSGGGLGEPRGWIGGGRAGYAPHGPARAGQGQAGPSTTEVLVELRTLRALLTPLLEAAGGEPASPPLPQRRPGQERPGIPRQRGEQAERGEQGEQAERGERGERAERAVGGAAGQAGGPIAGEGDVPRLADSEETWW